MEFNGLPLHPLVVHAVVVFAPLAALAALAFAAVPRWRWLLRWPLVAVTLIAVSTAIMATLSGDALVESRPELAPLVATHSERGELLRNVLLGFGVLSVLAAFRLGGPTALVSGRGERTRHGGAVDVAVVALVAVAAVAVLALTFLTGDSGARAVWEQ